MNRGRFHISRRSLRNNYKKKNYPTAQACSVPILEHWSCSFFASLWIEQQKLDQYCCGTTDLTLVQQCTCGFPLSRKATCFGFLRYTIGLKNVRHFFIQLEAKQKPIVTHAHAFSRAKRQLHVFTSSFDWFIRLAVSFVIG